MGKVNIPPHPTPCSAGMCASVCSVCVTFLLCKCHGTLASHPSPPLFLSGSKRGSSRKWHIWDVSDVGRKWQIFGVASDSSATWTPEATNFQRMVTKDMVRFSTMPTVAQAGEVTSTWVCLKVGIPKFHSWSIVSSSSYKTTISEYLVSYPLFWSNLGRPTRTPGGIGVPMKSRAAEAVGIGREPWAASQAAFVGQKQFMRASSWEIHLDDESVLAPETIWTTLNMFEQLSSIGIQHGQ